ncbi:hypothetical protein ACIQTZ_22915 [Paenarthrobacter sp. NPDC090520]|jgi:hypothetical protein|uniref:hypothetical protein n=1 Tax=Paenarthrobacter sp. NPDC090520 TaxID=3364382 RepID=UPI0037F6A2E5
MLDFTLIKDAILVAAGNIFIIIFIFRSLGAYAKKEYGELITNVLAAVVLVGFIYFTDSSINVFKWIWGQISGTPVA